jgi:hypothetical protein
MFRIRKRPEAEALLSSLMTDASSSRNQIADAIQFLLRRRTIFTRRA